jgi:hypothetical protein
LHPDTRICSPFKSCTRIRSLASIKLCTAILRKCLRASFVYLDKIRGRMSACTAIAPARNRNLYPDCKNCAMPRSLRLWWDYHHSQFSLTASIRLSTTNALYCRAVSCKANLSHIRSVPGFPTRAQEFCSPSLQPCLRYKTHAFLPPDSELFYIMTFANSLASLYIFIISSIKNINSKV